MYVPKQTSVESTNSFSENDEASEGQFSVLKAIREDPETTKKKEMHKNLMNEALKKVEMRNIQKKNFSQLARTNPTLAALNIVTRKELKMEELQEKLENEDPGRNRNKSGSSTKDDQSSSSSHIQTVNNNSSVNSGVLQTFRELSIHKGHTGGQNSASRQAAIAAKKASTPVKPDAAPKPQSISKQDSVATSSTSTSDLTIAEPQSTPVVVLRKQPRILDADELKARTSGTGPIGGNATPGNDVVSSLPTKTTLNNVSSVQETNEKAELIPIQSETSNASNIKPNASVTQSVNMPDLSAKPNQPNASSQSKLNSKMKVSDSAFTQERKPASPVTTPSSKEKDDRVEKALEKVNAAKELAKQQRVDNQKSSVSVKQNLEGLVHVKPKVEAKQDVELDKVTYDAAGQKLVRRAAEKFEANLSEMNNKDFSNNSPVFSSNMRVRSKSISNRLREQMVDSKTLDTTNTSRNVLPWSGRSPPAIRRKDAMRNNKGCFTCLLFIYI